MDQRSFDGLLTGTRSPLGQSARPVNTFHESRNNKQTNPLQDSSKDDNSFSLNSEVDAKSGAAKKDTNSNQDSLNESKLMLEITANKRIFQELLQRTKVDSTQQESFQFESNTRQSGFRFRSQFKMLVQSEISLISVKSNRVSGTQPFDQSSFLNSKINPVKVNQLFTLLQEDDAEIQIKSFCSQVGMSVVMQIANPLGQSALHYVCLLNKMSYLKLLLDTACECLSNVASSSQNQSRDQSVSSGSRIVQSQGNSGQSAKTEVYHQIANWINQATLNAEQRYKAVHFASQVGNLEMIKYLVRSGADITQKAASGVTCYHLAAKGDHPRVIHYLLESQQFWVDMPDENRCTALHQACLEGAYQSVRYLLAKGADCSLKSHKEDFTPLHIAIQSLDYAQDTRIIYKLLVFKADLSIQDKTGKTPVDYITYMDDFNLQQEVRSIVRNQQVDTKGLFRSKCCKQKKDTSNLLWLYLASWLVMTFVLNLSLLNVPYVLKQVFQNKETASSENWDFVSQLVSITSFVEILTILLFFVLVIKNPGNLKRKDDFEFPTWNELMENVNFKMLCPECQIIKSPRSRHCYECQKCVSRFDHHCPWVKNCIGGKNNVTFFFFLFSLIALIALTFTIEVEVLMMTYQCHQTGNFCLLGASQDHINGDMWTNVALITLQSLVYSTFVVPVVQLFFVHVNNFYYGLTTNERFGRDAIKMEEQLATFKPNPETQSSAIGFQRSAKLQDVSIRILEEEMQFDISSMQQRQSYSQLGGQISPNTSKLVTSGIKQDSDSTSSRRFVKRKVPQASKQGCWLLCKSSTVYTQKELYIDYRRQLRQFKDNKV